MEPVILKTRAKKFTYFIGIDVSKNKLDFALLSDKQLLLHRETKNDPGAIVDFVTELKTISGFKVSKSIFCMENTGFYCNYLLDALKKLKANIVLENAVQIRQSLGLVRGKDDKTDAIRIGLYARKNKDELKFWEPRRPVVLALMNLFTLRNRLMSVSVVLKTPLKEQTAFIKKALQKRDLQLCRKSVDAIHSDLIDIDLDIELLINGDGHLRMMRELIISVPGVGLMTAVQIIIATNEFRDINDPKKFACYAGVVPFKRESGTLTKKARVSHYANKRLKALLHLCALNAMRYDPGLKAYYKRKTEEGKPKLLVINAIRNKLIQRIFACLKQERVYDKNYILSNELTAGESTDRPSLEI